MSNVCIGLFGTCGSSTWRNDFIAAYAEHNVQYFNPQVAEWKPEDAVIEAQHLVSDSIILFPVTGETYGTGSLAEIGFSVLSLVNGSPDRHIVIFVDPAIDESLTAANPALAKESTRARALVNAHLAEVAKRNQRVIVCSSLEEMLKTSIGLWKISQ